MFSKFTKLFRLENDLFQFAAAAEGSWTDAPDIAADGNALEHFAVTEGVFFYGSHFEFMSLDL